MTRLRMIIQTCDLTCEFREVRGYVRVHDLLLQDVGLVEEEYDGGALEPGVGDDGFEQGLALLHTVLELNGSMKNVGTRTPR